MAFTATKSNTSSCIPRVETTLSRKTSTNFYIVDPLPGAIVSVEGYYVSESKIEFVLLLAQRHPSRDVFCIIEASDPPLGQYNHGYVVSTKLYNDRPLFEVTSENNPLKLGCTKDERGVAFDVSSDGQKTPISAPTLCEVRYRKSARK